ncbi:hypothetical protein M2160_000035 [Streptomyces sp. SAI-117]|uniref:hypothetical protein n=1 Tax=Streptomyces sp. SAI-117 TaxID=2940546 RepID=UPI0024744F7D|nr:hypothetical protein [Streptomyces sp. SAI-117]MDH6565014.1 hypothetical protein [Streptomyces sp. SAI-117]
MVEEGLEEVEVAAVAAGCGGEGEAEGVEGVLDAPVVDGHPLGCCCGQDGGGEGVAGAEAGQFPDDAASCAGGFAAGEGGVADGGDGPFGDGSYAGVRQGHECCDPAGLCGEPFPDDEGGDVRLAEAACVFGALRNVVEDLVVVR